MPDRPLAPAAWRVPRRGRQPGLRSPQSLKSSEAEDVRPKARDGGRVGKTDRQVPVTPSPVRATHAYPRSGINRSSRYSCGGETKRPRVSAAPRPGDLVPGADHMAPGRAAPSVSCLRARIGPLGQHCSWSQGMAGAWGPAGGPGTSPFLPFCILNHMNVLPSQKNKPN